MPNSLQLDIGPSYLHTIFHPRKKIVWRWALHQIKVFYMVNIRREEKLVVQIQNISLIPLLGIIILRGMLGSSKFKNIQEKFSRFVQPHETDGSQTKSYKDLFLTYEKSTYHKPIYCHVFSMDIKIKNSKHIYLELHTAYDLYLLHKY